MKYWKITLKPLDAYFLGGERNVFYQNNPVQRSERRPYFIRSNHMISQSAAFGVLRYLGIHSPNANYRLSSEDIKNIGDRSFSITRNQQGYGRICSISPVFLCDQEGKRYVAAPCNRVKADFECCYDKEHPKMPFVSFEAFRRVITMDGTRYLPSEYNEKRACDPSDLLCLETGDVISSPFSTQIRTGINRESQKLKQNGNLSDDNPSGFFKKEYIVLDRDYSFMFYAETEDGFFIHRDTVVYIGQGRTPFSAHAEDAQKKWDIDLPVCCRPSVGAKWESATVISDMFFDGHIKELKRLCSLMISSIRDHRCMETNYSAENAGNRYSKKEALKLIPAGSVFLFMGDDNGKEPKDQLCHFRNTLIKTRYWDSALRAGFNYVLYSDIQQNGGQ